MHPIYSFNKYSSFQFPYMRRSIQRQGLAHNEGKLSLYVSNFTFNLLLHCYCIKTEQDCCDRRKSDKVLHFEWAGSKILYAVDHIFHLLCAFNYLQPTKKFLFSAASRATGSLQITPSGFGDKNESFQGRSFPK